MKTRKPKPWMRQRPDKAPQPTYADLTERLGALITACHRWRMYGPELTHAEHTYNRALVAKAPKRAIVRHPELL